MKREALRRSGAIVAALLVVVGAAWWWQDRDVVHFLTEDPAPFATAFPPPPARESIDTPRELDELLRLQAIRTPEDVAAARADRKTRVQRFYGALGFDDGSPPDLDRLEKLAERVADDVSVHARAVKDLHRRPRPYVIEPRLEPCIADVADDLSYPSGHSAFGWSMAYLLMRMVPEREEALRARAEEFARQRAICGVHFPSDLAAGERAARELLARLDSNAAFRVELAAATAELRAALKLPPRNPDRARRLSSARSRRIASRLRGNSRRAARVSCRPFSATRRTCAAARAARR